jgi:tetratricopeptide (TPR) repeat protein
MNRADRRRQEKLTAQTGRAQAPFAVQHLLDEGKLHYQAGRLSDAERAYRLALEMAPGHPEALHLMGLLAYRAGQFDSAIDFLQQATEQRASNPLYWFNLGVVTQRAGRLDESIQAYRTALRLNPRYVEACINLGNALKEQSAVGEAITLYRQALILNPAHADTHNNLGVALKEQGQLEAAIASYRQALRLAPTHVESLNNLGLALTEQGAIEEAIACFEQALAKTPGYQKALYNLGVAWSWAGKDVNAVDCLQQIARAKHDHGKAVTDTTIYRSRIKHDIEQIRYLLDHQRLGEEHRPYLTALQTLQNELDRSSLPGNRLPIPPDRLVPVAPSFNRMLYCVPPGRLDQGTLSSSLDVEAIEARYLARRPEVTHIDGLLKRETLDALRRFCWEATIWKKDYENGYSGAFLGDGFASPLLFQIAEELRLRFPRIFKSHRLTQAWAFKHDSARRGLNIHADAAAVNVNFWITPDEANLNPDTGGLVVYDKEAPKEWNFSAYNSDQNKPKILAWLREVGANAIKIPYRANRAVVFNSDLFHETDEIAFKDDYLSRRINITLLYGHRHQE